MANYFSVAFGFTLIAGAALGGELERRGDPSPILFEQGSQYLELSFGTLNPTVSGASLPTVPAGPTGDIGNSFQSIALGYKREINEHYTLAFVIDEPIGASVLYSSPTAFFAGSSAEVSSIAFTGMVKRQLSEAASIYGGLRVVGVEGDITVASPATAPNPYALSVNKDYDVGYILGAAYERPEIGLRVTATYESKTEHGFQNNAGAPFTVEVPQSFTLNARSGVAANTLVFGSVRWREWSEFRVQPGDFFSFVPGVGLVEAPVAAGATDIWTYELGIGRQFNEQWSGAFTLGYEETTGDPVSNLSGKDGYLSYGLGISYDAEDWTVSAGARYIEIGDATSSVVNFSGNDAVAFGVKIARRF